MAQDALNEVWYPIPGFPSYEVSTNFKVRNIVKGRELSISRNGNVFLRDTKDYRTNIPRVLYAAIHQINPRDLGRVFIVADSDNNIKLIERSDFLRSLNNSKRYNEKSTESAIAYYEAMRNTIDTILKFYETGDLTDVFYMVYQEEDAIIDYARKRGLIESEEMGTELFYTIAEKLITGIQKKEYLCIDIPKYLKRMARSYSAAWRKEYSKVQTYSRISSKHHLALIDSNFK